MLKLKREDFTLSEYNAKAGTISIYFHTQSGVDAINHVVVMTGYSEKLNQFLADHAFGSTPDAVMEGRVPKCPKNVGEDKMYDWLSDNLVKAVNEKIEAEAAAIKKAKADGTAALRMDNLKAADSVNKIGGLNANVRKALKKADIRTIAGLADQSVDDLVGLGGISEALASKMIMIARNISWDMTDGTTDESVA